MEGTSEPSARRREAAISKVCEEFAAGESPYGFTTGWVGVAPRRDVDLVICVYQRFNEQVWNVDADELPGPEDERPDDLFAVEFVDSFGDGADVQIAKFGVNFAGGRIHAAWLSDRWRPELPISQQFGGLVQAL